MNTRDSRQVGFQGGYSGGNQGKNPEGVNNPSFEGLEDIGPIPKGSYIMTRDGRGKSSPLGPNAIMLTAVDKDDLLGTSDLYRIHGDSKKFPGQQKASQGCIIYGPDIRNLILENLIPGEINILTVVE